MGRKRKKISAIIMVFALSMIMCMPAMAATTVGKPTISSVTASGTTAVKILSNKPGNARKWSYYCYNTAGKQVKAVTNRTSNNYTMTGLTPGTQYSFSVKCLNSTGKVSSAMSARKTVTLPMSTPSIRSVSISTTSVRITPTKPAGTKSYIYFCYDKSGKQLKSVSSTATSYTFSGLSVGTTYKFKVIAKGANRNSSYSAEKLVTTSLPTPYVSNVTTTTNSATVTAGTATGLKKWTFYCYNRAGKQVASKTATTNKTTFTNLLPAEKYTFKVATSGANKTSGLSGVKEAITSISAPTVNSVTTSGNAITANVSKPAGTKTFAYYCYNSKGTLVTSKTGVTTQSYTFNGLNYSETYSIKAIAQGTSAKSAFSAGKTVTTEDDPKKKHEESTQDNKSEFSIYEVGANEILVTANDGKGGYVVCSKTELKNPAEMVKSEGIVADNGTGSSKEKSILITYLDQSTKYYVYASKDKTNWKMIGTVTTEGGSNIDSIARIYKWAKDFEINGAFYVSGVSSYDIESWWKDNVINGDARSALYKAYKSGLQKIPAYNSGKGTLFILSGTSWKNIALENNKNDTLAKEAIKEAGITKSDSSAVKVTKMMNWLADNTSYVSANEEGAISCFTTHKSSCNGYADALNAMCKAENIPCHLVFGTCNNGSGTVNHAFNEINLDGKWYYIDPTWYDSGVKGIYINHYGPEGKMIGYVWNSHVVTSKFDE